MRSFSAHETKQTWRHSVSMKRKPFRSRLLPRRRKATPQERERLAQVGRHFIVWCCRFGIACANEDAQPNPGSRTGFHVADFIPQHHAAGQIEPEFRCGLQEHSRLGLAPEMIATVLADAMQRVMRAVIDAADCRAFRFKAIAHPSRQVSVGFFVEMAAANAGLVGDDNDRPPQLIGPETSQLKDSRNEFELFWPMDVSAVHIDDAVPVEEKSAAGHRMPPRVDCYGTGNRTLPQLVSPGPLFLRAGAFRAPRCRAVRRVDSNRASGGISSALANASS
jgi:hypothetical protein